MKRYIIMVECRNSRCPDQTFFFGKEFSELNTYEESLEMSEDSIDYLDRTLIEKYGFKTKAGANKALKAHIEMTKDEIGRECWAIPCKIIEVNI